MSVRNSPHPATHEVPRSRVRNLRETWSGSRVERAPCHWRSLIRRGFIGRDLSRSAFLESVKTAIRLLQINGDSRRQPRIAASDSSWGSLHRGDGRMLACNDSRWEVIFTRKGFLKLCDELRKDKQFFVVNQTPDNAGTPPCRPSNRA